MIQMKLKTSFILTLLSFCSISLAAQSSDFLRSTGKIYSVVAVVLLLFLGFVFYMIRIERKIKELENKDNE